MTNQIKRFIYSLRSKYFAFRVIVIYTLVAFVYITGSGILFDIILDTKDDVIVYDRFRAAIFLFGSTVLLYRILYRHDQSTKKYENELKNAKKNAEESDKLKSYFLSNLSHEIRTPLNSIYGFSDLIAEEGFDSVEKSFFVENMKKNIDRLLNVTENVLCASEIQVGALSIKKDIVSVNEVLIRECDLLREKILKFDKDIIVQFFVSDEINVRTDKGIFIKVVKCLTDNALEYTEKGRIDIIASINNNMLEVHVKDTGIGIPQEKHSKIFDAFVQVDNSATRRFEGLGLGLYLAASIVNLMGGYTTLNSEPSVGSDFAFCLPIDID